MKSTDLGIVIVLALLAAGAIFYTGASLTAAPAKPPVQSYSNDALGVSFTFPAGYVLSEQDIGAPLQAHYVITLIREEDAVPPQNGEGPTAITLDFYNRDTEESLNNWLALPQSNFTLGDGTLASTSVDGTEAVRYVWSGLYQGETTAFLHNGNAVAVSVTYLSPGDQIRSDYAAVLSSLTLH